MTQATIPSPAVSQQLAREFGLGAEECAGVPEIRGRAPSLTELGVFSVLWSARFEP
jgi:phosphoribosylformylglycinamidine (FGAM) synthase-like enzyme